jgi:hypothetical protein
MSAGAVFKLIANEGKADRMIMASRLLSQRIKDVSCARRAAGEVDTTPTLADIERTHIVYVNAHFKPFAAIGYEYNKVRPQSGGHTLGTGATFSIPQFGDFFHDMVAHVRLSSFTGNAGDTPLQGSSAFPLNDGYNFYNIVDSAGNVLVAGVDAAPTEQVSYRNFVRYCEYPGNRLFSRVAFDVNGNPLDDYTEMVPMMLEKFCVQPNKRDGHDRMVGQEVALNGYGGISVATVTDADSANTPNGITRANMRQSSATVALFNANTATVGAADAGTTLVGQTALSTLNPISELAQYDVSRKLQQIVNGPQTPKPVQAPLEIWNKLRFWFNDDVRLAVPSVSIPFGQRFISVELCLQDELAFEYPSIYLETIFDDSSTRSTTYSPIFQQFKTTAIAVEDMNLYINNIFVNPEIHNIYIERIGFSLIRVYRKHVCQVSQSETDEKLLSSLKWPIEYLFVGFRPAWNVKSVVPGSGGLIASGNQNKWRDWHRLTRMVDAATDNVQTTINPGGAAAGTATATTGQIIPDSYYLPVPTVNSMSLSAHGITIFDDFSDTFYNQYMPSHYGGSAIVTPNDPGAMFVNLSLFPRSYQPSGHLNISRARETYLRWATSYISKDSPAELIAIAVAINFLLITDGSAVLRYAT